MPEPRFFTDPMVTATFGIIFGATLAYLYNRRLNKHSHKRAISEAARAWRFELELNRQWLRRIFDTRLYLREDAWLKLRNAGLISYLLEPLPRQSIILYEQFYYFNNTMRDIIAAASNTDPNKIFEDLGKIEKKAKPICKDLSEKLNKLIEEFDKRYPDLKKGLGGSDLE